MNNQTPKNEEVELKWFPIIDWQENYVKVLKYMVDELKVSAEEFDQIVTVLYATKDFRALTF